MRFATLLLTFLFSLTQASDRAVVLVYDASGSMWANMGNSTRVETARGVLSDFLNKRDNSIPLGVIAYGHNRKGDCADIEVIAPVGKQTKALTQKLNAISPKGKTPLSDALRLAAKQIPKTAEEADIVLITDGLETCEADPCTVANELAAEGIKLRAHVVGFGMSETDTKQLACIPNRTGGKLLSAQNGADLSEALKQTTQKPKQQKITPKTIPLTISLTEKEGVSVRVPTVATITATDANGQILTLGKTAQRSLKAALPKGKWTLSATTDNGWTGEMSVTLPRNSDQLYLPLAPMAGDMRIVDQLGDYQAGVTTVFLYDIQRIPGDGTLLLAILPEGSNDRYADGAVYSYIDNKVGKIAKKMDLPKKPGKYKAVITYDSKYEPLAEIPIAVAVDPEVSLTLKNPTVNPSDKLLFTAKGSQNYIDLIEIRKGDEVIESIWYFDTIKNNQPQITAPQAEGNYTLVYVRRNADDSKTDAASVSFTVGKQLKSTAAMSKPQTTGTKSMTLTLPANAPSEVSWEALPHESNTEQDVWAPHETTPRIQAELPLGRWTVIATGLAETEYRAELNITDAWQDGLTIVIPYNNIAGGDGAETHPSMIKASEAMIADLKATFIDLQTQQTTAHVLNETKQRVAAFIQQASGKLGNADYHDIKTLLSEMGKPFVSTLKDWQSAEANLLRNDGNESSESTNPTAQSSGEDIAMVCKTAPFCQYDNAEFGLHLKVPYGWALSTPYFYQTAGGAKADKATVLFIRQRDDVTVSLNQRQASGHCLDTKNGRLCYFAEDNIDSNELGTIIMGAN